jgi:hypothetical protein
MRLLIVCIATLYTGSLNAEPKFSANVDSGKVVLHDDKCTLTEVTNLPFRAQWVEGNKVFEGCWTPPPSSSRGHHRLLHG